jgi:hypothetical protein
MKRLFNLTKAILMLLTLGISQLGCTNEPILEFQEASLKTSITEKSSANRTNQSRFNASLNGGNEVPAVETHAVGQAIVTISKDETKIHYKLIVANIDDVIQSHFHVAPAGTNGGVVAFLFGPNPIPQPSGPFNGVLAEGDIMASNVIGSIAGDLDALIAAIRSGNVYINVHTNTNKGGEIRGQL